MKIAKTFRLIRLTWLEIRIKRLQNKKNRLISKIDVDVSLLSDSQSKELTNALEILSLFGEHFSSGVDSCGVCDDDK